MLRKFLLIAPVVFGLAGVASAQDVATPQPDVDLAPKADDDEDPVKQARDANELRLNCAAKGLAWLKTSQHPDGHYGKKHTIAITGMAGLALLSSQDDPFASPETLKAVNWLLPKIKAGSFPHHGHTWIHGQGFATLFLAEVYGRAYLAKKRPNLDLVELKATVQACLKAIESAQSSNGGWWYHAAERTRAEGSTTVCAVQALRSGTNFGFDTDPEVLAKGFEYLKKCQNKNGSFMYQLGDGRNMLEGTAGDIATLAMMEKADYPVLLNGVKYLGTRGAAAISGSRFPYYGHFYGLLGMKLVDEEMGGGIKTAAGWSKPVVSWMTSTQLPSGEWNILGWMKSDSAGDTHYSTALAVMTLGIADGRLSIYKRPALYIYEKDKKD